MRKWRSASEVPRVLLPSSRRQTDCGRVRCVRSTSTELCCCWSWLHGNHACNLATHTHNTTTSHCKFCTYIHDGLQWFDTVGWVSARASACKNWVVGCDNLSAARCRLFAYGPANVSDIPKPASSLASFKSRLILPFWYRLTQVDLEEAIKLV